MVRHRGFPKLNLHHSHQEDPIRKKIRITKMISAQLKSPYFLLAPGSVYDKLFA
jgi:hypothetical protein